MLSAFITGVAGERLNRDEARFLADARPAGLILFGRNVHDPHQLRSLVGDVCQAIGSDRIIISVDQEGGRVQRLRLPHWRALPPGRAYGRLYRRDAVSGVAQTRHAAHLIASELRALGINTNMVPVLDVPDRRGHPVISDRAYGRTCPPVIALGRAVAEGHVAGGVVPVMKHIPGHGRAKADSHYDLPVVKAPLAALRRRDFAPFAALSDLPAAMSAHVVYNAIDRTAPASISAIVHERIIRGEIGFDGLLMSDDLSMKALSGDIASRAAAVIAAGSDLVLHCNGELREMMEIAAVVPALSGKALTRFERALAITDTAAPPELVEAGAAISAGLAVWC